MWQEWIQMLECCCCPGYQVHIKNRVGSQVRLRSRLVSDVWRCLKASSTKFKESIYFGYLWLIIIKWILTCYRSVLWLHLKKGSGQFTKKINSFCFCPKEAVIVFRMSAEDRRSASVPARSHPSHRGGASQHLDKTLLAANTNIWLSQTRQIFQYSHKIHNLLYSTNKF